MPRARRIDLPDTTHHVVNRGVARQQIFFDDVDRIRFCELIGECNERFGITIVAYCLMDNHYHLIVYCPDAVLSQAMQYLGGRFADHVNARHGRTGHLFGARFHSSLIDSNDYMLAAVRYVERNSLAIDGVESPERYRWSSVRAHLGLRAGPDWLDTTKVASWFQSTSSYADFVGREQFTAEPPSIDIGHVDAVVELMIDTHVDPDASRSGLSRTVMVGVGETLGANNRRRVHEHLDLHGGRSVQRALRRAHNRTETHPSISAAVAATRSWLFDLGTHADRRAA